MFDNLARWHRDEVEAAKLLGERIGEQIGSIKTMIELLPLFGVDKENTIERVCTKFYCSKKEAEDYYKLYHND